MNIDDAAIDVTSNSSNNSLIYLFYHAKFQLQSEIDKKVEEMSLGNQRKLSVALAFLGNPSIIFLDEPTAGKHFFNIGFKFDKIKKL